MTPNRRREISNKPNTPLRRSVNQPITPIHVNTIQECLIGPNEIFIDPDPTVEIDQKKLEGWIRASNPENYNGS